MLDYSCHPIWASASVWNEGLFRDTNNHFGHFFVFCSTCFHQSKCFFFLKMITNRFGWAIQIVWFWFTMALSCMVCCAGVLPAKQITRHDSSLLYSAELLFVVVVVCFYFFLLKLKWGHLLYSLLHACNTPDFPPICFQTCKLRSPSVWVYGNEMQKHGAFVFTHIFPKLR